MNNRKNIFMFCLILLAVPAAVIASYIIFKEKFYAVASVLTALISCLPLFYAFNKKTNNSKELTVVAVMIAISVVGRFVFAFLPGFKPVTAITVIAAVYIGKEAGFAVGSLSAVVSNFYFGQGPWTPFQMFAWGILGFIAGLLYKYLKKSKIALCVYGVLSGVLYSLTMDIFTVLVADGTFNLSRYLTLVLAASPTTAEYAVSNVIFLLLLTKPIGEKLERIKTKYGLFAV